MRTREHLERIEDTTLAPYAMRSAASEGREHEEAEHPYRTRYQRDRDRIVHCEAFRRLEYKTQVFANHQGDTYRTRLTHTIEVAQIARTIARTLGLNPELTETLALVHDLGHAPFGHAGQDALAALMEAHGGFEHNRQALRIVSRIERRYPAFEGLNLTFETREGMSKHGDFRKSGAAAAFRPDDAPLLEAQVADRADRLAYNHHDLDDGLTAGILTEETVRSLPHVDAAFVALDARSPGLPFRVRVNQVFIRLMNDAVTDLVHATSRRITASGVASVADVRAAPEPLVGFSAEGAVREDALHAFLYEHFYCDWRVARMQEDAKRFLTTVFAYFVDHPRTLPPFVRSAAERDGLERAVCDHVSTMTDRELHHEYRRITAP